MHPVSHVTGHRSIDLSQAVKLLIHRAMELSLLSTRGMPVRSFVDRAGVTWRVWATRPSRATVLSNDFADGWLTFESESSVRRLAPVPDGWVEASDDRLYLMCRAAEPMPRRTGAISADLSSSDEDPPRPETR